MGTTLEDLLLDLQAFKDHLNYLIECKGMNEKKKYWDERILVLEGFLKDDFSDE
jgi:hypothetical protein